MTAQNYEKPGLSQARAFCILGTSPLPIGKWATSNLILVQQKRRSKSKDKRDASQACFSCRYEQRRGYMVIRMLPMEKIGWKKK